MSQVYSDMSSPPQLVTKAPADCMCRPCTAVEDEVTASEVSAGYSDPGSMLKSFVKMY